LAAHDASPPDDRSLSDLVSELSRQRSSEWAWTHYKDTIQSLIALRSARNVVEIGGGRWPLLDKAEIASAAIRYIVNDIAEGELERAPDYVEKACFDIGQQAPLGCPEFHGRIDLTFSKMVFEHIHDTYQAYRNIYTLLAPGGICLNFHPVLYSPPFLINYLFPETISSKLLRAVFPERNPDDAPKFPAYYDHCLISERERSALLAIGYQKAWQIPFWYHWYFRKIPGVYHLDHLISKTADRKDWTTLASYCYTLVMK
jgi:SAM-dependent methyltransferase